MAFGLLDENFINRHGFRVAKRVPRVQGRGWEETMHIWNLLAVAVLLLSIQARGAGAADILGAWHPEQYVLEDGTELDVSGLIFFFPREIGPCSSSWRMGTVSPCGDPVKAAPIY